MKPGDYRVDRGSRREGSDPVWAEPDWDAPHHRRHDLLPVNANCGNCKWYAASLGVCGWLFLVEGGRLHVLEGHRCNHWKINSKHAEEVAQRAALKMREPGQKSWATRRAGA